MLWDSLYPAGRPPRYQEILILGDPLEMTYFIKTIGEPGRTVAMEPLVFVTITGKLSNATVCDDTDESGPERLHTFS